MVEERHLLSAWGFALCTVFFAPGALADSRSLTDAIHVEPGATCLDADGLAGEVATWLDTDQVDDDVWVRVEGSADDPRVAWFEMGRGHHVLAHRRFDPGPARCEHLEAMLGLAIALAIKVSLVEELTGQAPPAKAPEAPKSEPSETWAAGADALAAVAVVPGLSGGLDVRVEKPLPPNFVVRLGALGLAGGRGTFDHVAGSFSAEVAALRVDVCVRQILRAGSLAVRIGGCTGLLAGALFLQGRDFAASRSAVAAWSALGTGVDVAVDVGAHWSLEAQTGALLPFGHTTVGAASATGSVVDSRELASVGGLFALGSSYRF